LCPLLLQTIVMTGVFCPSLLCYYCSGAIVATNRLRVATMAYGLMLQCLFIIVYSTLISARKRVVTITTLSG
jgi:hypothetical protein